jgi:hypothetical protein
MVVVVVSGQAPGVLISHRPKVPENPFLVFCRGEFRGGRGKWPSSWRSHRPRARLKFLF